MGYYAGKPRESAIYRLMIAIVCDWSGFTVRNALKAESSLLKLEYKTYVLGLNRKKEPTIEI